MSDLTVNGLPVVDGRITLGRSGAWIAELHVNAETAAQLPAGQSASLQLASGQMSFSGTVLPGFVDAYASSVGLRVIGGKNGLASKCRAHFYQSTDVGTVMGDLLRDGGESMSGAPSTVLGVQLPFWTTAVQTVGDALTSLAEAADPGATWRVMADGTVWLGVDGYQASALTEFELIEYVPQDAAQVIAAELPDVFPGESFNGRNVSAVLHRVTEARSRVTVFYEQ